MSHVFAVGHCVDGRYSHRSFNGLFLFSCSKISTYLEDVVGEFFQLLRTEFLWAISGHYVC